ncbi:hypothetical protein EYF80_014333 [Liparis tanakae]|uniref:Uncharacterized protein n=1 Tax=Liparis tanakae TaxID=230148 RepID=A0A4Z2ICS2_9TELE|nr:hypothetical protein EYF80_014333 [Liparis tanakae]
MTPDLFDVVHVEPVLSVQIGSHLLQSSCLDRKERLISATESSLSSTLSVTEFSDSDWLSSESSTGTQDTDASELQLVEPMEVVEEAEEAWRDQVEAVLLGLRKKDVPLEGDFFRGWCCSVCCCWDRSCWLMMIWMSS